jgi:hypothetical protein
MCVEIIGLNTYTKQMNTGPQNKPWNTVQLVEDDFDDVKETKTDRP